MELELNLKEPTKVLLEGDVLKLPTEYMVKNLRVSVIVNEKEVDITPQLNETDKAFYESKLIKEHLWQK